MSGRIARIHRFPVKGLSPELLDWVDLSPGQGLPGDRRYGLARAGVDLDSSSPRWLPKRNFLMLMQNPRLAALDARLESEDGVLEIRRGGHAVARGRLGDPVGRAIVEDFFAAYLGTDAGGKPRLVETDADHPFTDSPQPFVPLINLASVADLERTAGVPVDPVRFRGNLLLEDVAPWREFDWIGRELVVGTVRLRVVERTGRCAATTVNPETGDRDLNVPRALQAGHGHTDLGVYARVETGGTVEVGDRVTPAAADGATAGDA